MLLMSKYLPCLLLVVLLRAVVFAESADFEQTHADFVHMAEKMPYLALGSVLYDAPDHGFEVADIGIKNRHFEVLKQVTDPKYTVEALLHLLKHDDPKVRTLAAVALFDREEPSVLPALVDLCDDKSPTFDGHPELSAIWLRHTGIGPPALKQTVSDIIQAMVGFYMHPAGFLYGIKDTSHGFAKYWEARKNRTSCAAWFLVRLERTRSGGNRNDPDSAERVKKLRQRIDQLPADDRTWVLLWLNGEMGSDALVTEPELLEACKRLGSDKLMLMLRNKIPTDDPDLQPRPSNNWKYHRMCLFVLKNATMLLRPGDAEALLACSRLDPNNPSSLWEIAAASLNKFQASHVLHGAMNRFNGEYDAQKRADLCAAIWRSSGEAEIDYIVEWFYNEKPDRGTHPTCLGSFVLSVGKEKNGGLILGHLIKDPRFAKIGGDSLNNLVRAVNGCLDKPVVTEEEIQAAWAHFIPWTCEADQTSAEKRQPKEAAAVIELQAVWRERLLECAPELNKVKK